MFSSLNFQIEQVNEKVFNFYSAELSFSFIELKRIGAPAIMDFILSLGVTKCKNLIFLGSAGSLSENIKIGDIVVPKYSICEEGFTLIEIDKCLNYNNTMPKENGFVCEGENTRLKGNICVIYEITEAKI